MRGWVNWIKRQVLLLFWLISGGNLFRKSREKLFPPAEDHQPSVPLPVTRRELIKNLAAIPFFGGFFWTLIRSNTSWASLEEQQLNSELENIRAGHSLGRMDKRLTELQGEVPRGNLGDRQFSRLILGGNFASARAHARDLIYVSDLMRAYNTDEKVFETLFLAEAAGINALVARVDNQILGLINGYRRQGGKIQWMAQYHPDELDELRLAVDNGAATVHTQGSRTESLVRRGRVDIVHEAVELGKSYGLPSGVSSHLLEVPEACEAEGIDPDYYVKTLHHFDYWSAPAGSARDIITPSSRSPRNEETIVFMERVRKPWVTMKVLAAGAIPPRSGLQYTFESGADFACVGMFDFQVVENCNIVSRLFSESLNRRRGWYS